ncbi:MAG TPA: response regulator, partial [Desulfobacteraceae bacterium]|nr:response regulator [Desulfobacteraceae bacterium]
SEPGGLDTSILRGKRVLLVDDDSVNRLLGETVLRKINCDVRVSDSGEEAIDILNSKKFDLVLLDIQMPEPDGYAVADHIRNRNKDKETKIIAFTAATGDDEINKFHDAGIDDFVIKPYREKYLQNKMCKVLGLQYKQEMLSGSEIILKKTSKPGLYDLSNIEAMAGNNEAIKSTAIKDFLKNSEESITLFENYIAGKKWVEAGKTAHKLIPSYTHLQADTALSLLKQIELRSKNIRGEDIRSFENLISQAIKEIKQLVKMIKKENY